MTTDWRRSKFVWGQTDCILSVCNVILERTGIDPAGPWRGTYSDEAGAQALYLPWGGVLGLFAHGMARAGFRRIPEPVPGCPVVCRAFDKEVAGLWLGPRVAFMAERGVIEMRAEVVGAWDLAIG